MSNAVKGNNGQIELRDDCIVITRKGILGVLSQGLKGEKRIPYTSISAVQFKPAGLMFAGYIQFTIIGGNEARGGVFNATSDENTVMFNDTKSFAQLRDEVESRVAKAKLPQFAPAPAVDLADQIAKLGGLLEKGLITRDEFDTQKAKLLNS